MSFTTRAKYMIINSLLIISAVIGAIGIKAVMPASVNVEDFDGILVQLMGFPFVAVMYFVILFMHCLITMRYYGSRSDYSNLSIGIAFGSLFFLMYLVGMQEVVVEASPYNVWGIPFVMYQFIIGISDAIPVMLICIVSAYFTLCKKNGTKYSFNKYFSIKAFLVIVGSFILARTIGYETGIITSNVETFPIPSYAWTLIFGITLGFMYFILYPIYSYESQVGRRSFNLVVVTIGINWIMFNSFIGFIISGTIVQMILRSSIDILVLFAVSLVVDGKFIREISAD